MKILVSSRDYKVQSRIKSYEMALLNLIIKIVLSQ